MPKTIFIYCLKDPPTGDVRYIGKTDNLKKRFSAHLKASAKRKNHLGNWLRSLSESPVLAVLYEVAEGESWQEEERRYISCARAMGVDLVNSTDGGEGGSGPCSPERRAAKRGVPPSPECLSAAIAANTGVPRSVETRAAISAALKGVPLSPEHCAAISASTRGVPKSPEQCAAMRVPKSPENRAARRGVPWSPARRAAYERGKI